MSFSQEKWFHSDKVHVKYVSDMDSMSTIINIFKNPILTNQNVGRKLNLFGAE